MMVNATPEQQQEMEAAISQLELQAARQVWESLPGGDQETLIAAFEGAGLVAYFAWLERSTGETATQIENRLGRAAYEAAFQAGELDYKEVIKPTVQRLADLGLLKPGYVHNMIRAGTGWPPATRYIPCGASNAYVLTRFGSIIARYGNAVTIVEKSKAQLPVTP